MASESSRPKLLLIVVCLAQFMVILDVSIVNVALPSIRSDLGFSETGLQWVVNAYTLTFAGFLMLGGRACDLLGRRIVFLSGTALFAVASLACALAESKGLLLGARALQGLGAAVISPATLAILSTSYEGAERNRALGVWGAMGGLGGAAGVLFGGILTEALSWPWIFVINVPLGAAVVFAGRALIAEGRRDLAERHVDVLGAVLVTVGLSTLVYGIVRTDAIGWGSPGVLGPIAASIALLGAFFAVESRVSAPLMPLSTLRLGQLRAANLLILLLGSALFAMWFFLTLYMQGVLGANALRTGLQFLPMTLMIVVAATVAPKLLARVGARPVLTAGLVFAGVGMLLLSQVRADGHYVVDILPGGLLCATGLGLALVPATIVGVQELPPEQSGLGSGLLNTSRLVGGSLGLAVLSTIAASRTSDVQDGGASAREALTSGYALGLGVGGGICLVAALVAIGLLREPREAAAPAAQAVVDA